MWHGTGELFDETKALSYKVKYISMKALFEEQFSRNWPRPLVAEEKEFLCRLLVLTALVSREGRR